MQTKSIVEYNSVCKLYHSLVSAGKPTGIESMLTSGDGTNLKVGGTGPEQKWGAPIRRKAPEKKLFLVVPSTFLALKVVALMSAFVMVSTVWSVYCLLFFYSRCPPCPAICKSGGHMHPCPIESAPLLTTWPKQSIVVGTEQQLLTTIHDRMFADAATHV